MPRNSSKYFFSLTTIKQSSKLKNKLKKTLNNVFLFRKSQLYSYNLISLGLIGILFFGANSIYFLRQSLNNFNLEGQTNFFFVNLILLIGSAGFEQTHSVRQKLTLFYEEEILGSRQTC